MREIKRHFRFRGFAANIEINNSNTHTSFVAPLGYHAGVGRVGLAPPVGFFPLFKLEFSQQKKKFSAEITMSTLPKWVI